MPNGKHDVTEENSARTLDNDQIVTERKVPRRLFLGATSGVVISGTVAFLSSLRTAHLGGDPKDTDKRTVADPKSRDSDRGDAKHYDKDEANFRDQKDDDK